ncbi:unnamed protein product, partial [Cladocopium goreaui]
MIGVEASAAAAVAAPAVPERGSERNEGRGDADTATSVAPFSTQRLLHLLSELKEYQVASNHERLEVRCERVEQKTRLARLEQQLLAEEQIGHDLARRIETLEEAIRQERQMQEKSLSQAFSLQEGMAPRWAANLDAFRTVPKDLAEASATGAAMTLVATVTCVVLFLCETSAFLRSERRTDVALDSNQDSMLNINFDVTMLDMSCDHVTVGVWDAFGSERMNITKNIRKQRIDHKGADQGHPYTDDEVTDLEFSDECFGRP